MSYTLPPAEEANTESVAADTAFIAAANAAFIANTTVLIINAINNGFFQVEPFVIPYLSIPTVTEYFQSYGYTVLYPIVPPGPFEAMVLQPQVIPPGYIPPNQPQSPGYPRIQISWPSGGLPPGFLELEDGFLFLYEDGSFIGIE